MFIFFIIHFCMNFDVAAAKYKLAFYVYIERSELAELVSLRKFQNMKKKTTMCQACIITQNL